MVMPYFKVLSFDWAVEPMARVPRVARDKIFLARGIHCCSNFFPANPATS
jgi:hypothetical protein